MALIDCPDGYIDLTRFEDPSVYAHPNHLNKRLTSLYSAKCTSNIILVQQAICGHIERYLPAVGVSTEC